MKSYVAFIPTRSFSSIDLFCRQASVPRLLLVTPSVANSLLRQAEQLGHEVKKMVSIFYLFWIHCRCSS